MSQAEFDHELQKLVELEGSAANKERGAAKERSSLPVWAPNVLRAWYTLATLIAILVACVGVCSPMGSQGTAPLSSDLPSLESGHDSTPSYGSLSAQNSVAHRWSHDYQALESECDSDDIDSDATAALTLSLECAPAADLLSHVQSAGTLIGAKHLRISAGFARGPPCLI